MMLIGLLLVLIVALILLPGGFARMRDQRGNVILKAKMDHAKNVWARSAEDDELSEAELVHKRVQELRARNWVHFLLLIGLFVLIFSSS